MPQAPIPGANEPGAGNAGVSPADLAKHGVPAADAGQQEQQDQATEAANLQKAIAKPKSRKVTITGRGHDGRANQFHVEEA